MAFARARRYNISMPSTDEELKKALKTFRKRINASQREEDSRLGRGPIGSPNFETDVLGTLIYRSAFGGSSMASNDVRMSYAIALALIVFVAMAVVSTILIRVLRRREIEA